jgi:UDP-N-acetylmuramate dehydrogenase
MGNGSQMFFGHEIQKITKGEVRFNESMAKHTSFAIGGPTDYFLTVGEIEELREILLISKKKRIAIRVIGLGTNLLVQDKGLKGLVISLGGGFAAVKFDGDCLLAGAATRLSTLIKLAASRGLGGLEFAVGIPGTLGGAIITNAGSSSSSISQRLKNIRVMTRGGKIKTLTPPDLNFGYRQAHLPPGDIILDARLKLTRMPEEDILREMNASLKRRQKTQPLGAANAGCIFKNPDPHTPAGRLIEEAGLKGKRIGGAAVSHVHANFICNLKQAKAEDVVILMDLIREKVKERTGVMLEPEIEIWRENSRDEK